MLGAPSTTQMCEQEQLRRHARFHGRSLALSLHYYRSNFLFEIHMADDACDTVILTGRPHEVGKAKLHSTECLQQGATRSLTASLRRVRPIQRTHVSHDDHNKDNDDTCNFSASGATSQVPTFGYGNEEVAHMWGSANRMFLSQHSRSTFTTLPRKDKMPTVVSHTLMNT